MQGFVLRLQFIDPVKQFFSCLLPWHGSLYSSAARVTEHEEHLDAEGDDGVFETRNDFRRDDITGDASDKDVSDGLIKNEFDGNARVSTSEDGSKGLLLLDGVFPENP